jgi:hypothetical protein
MSASGRMAGRAYVELGVNDKLTKGLQAAQAKLQAFGDGVKAAGIRLAALGGGAVAGLVGAAAAFAHAGSELHDMSARTGVAVEALGELSYAAQQNGVEIDALEGGLRRMQKTVTEAALGSESAQEALGLLGVSVQDLAGLRPEEVFALLGDRLSQIPDPTLRAGAAMKVFGKSGTGLLPMLASGAAGLAAMANEAREFGLVMSTDDAEAADALGDAFDLLKATGMAFLNSVGAALAPLLTDLATGAARVVASAIEWVRANRDVIVSALKIAAVVAAVGGALVAAGVAVTAFGSVLGGLATVIGTVLGIAGALGTVIGALISPLGIAVGAVVAAAGALFYFSGAAGKVAGYAAEQFAGLRDDASDAFDGIRDALMAGDIELAAQILWQGLRAIWTRFTTEISKLWTGWIYDLVGALEVIQTEAARIFDAVTTTGADWITQASDALGIDGLVLGVDLNDDEVSQASKSLQQGLDQRSKDREQGLMDEIAAIEAARQQELDAADRELAAERKKLQDLVARAREERQAKDAARGATPGPEATGFDPWSAVKEIPAALDEAVTRIGSAGTFNAAAIQSLQLPSASPIERTAKAAEKTASGVTRLVGMAQQGGLLIEE